MGCHAETGETCFSDELPVHDVYVDSFYMDVYEVTNQQYCEYLNSAYGHGLIEVRNGMVHKAGNTEPYCDTTDKLLLHPDYVGREHVRDHDG